MSKKMRKKKKKKIRTKRSWIVDIPIGACLFFIIGGIVICTVFVFVTWHEGRLIDKSEAVSVSATFDSYIMHHSPKGSLNEIEICFKDRESLYMDSAYFNATIQDSLDQLDGGEQLDMLLHPSSEYIWEMNTEDDVILSFDDAKSRTQLEKSFFGVFLAGFCFICISMGIISLFVKYREHKECSPRR